MRRGPTTIFDDSAREPTVKASLASWYLPGLSDGIGDRLLQQTISRTIELIVHINRYPDGRRKVVSLSEITGMEGDVISIQELATFDHRGVDADGHVVGELRFTGVRPRCREKLQRAGVAFLDGGVR